MTEILLVKWLHIVSATVLFGTGLGSAFYKWRADKSDNLHVVTHTNKNVVLADWLFTTPTVIIQPITGLWLAHLNGYPFTTSWLLLSIALFLLAGACWLVVVYLQIKMRDMSIQCLNDNKPLPQRYWQLARLWFWLGIPAFFAIIVVFALMVSKPFI